VFGAPSEGGSIEDIEGATKEQGRAVHSLKNEQCGQLLKILEKFQANNNSNTGDHSVNANREVEL